MKRGLDALLPQVLMETATEEIPAQETTQTSAGVTHDETVMASR